MQPQQANSAASYWVISTYGLVWLFAGLETSAVVRNELNVATYQSVGGVIRSFPKI